MAQASLPRWLWPVLAGVTACTADVDDLFVDGGSGLGGEGGLGTGGALDGGGPVGGSPSGGNGPGPGGAGPGGAGPGGQGPGGAGGAGGAPATCGNGAIDVGEDCDGVDLGGVSCTAFGYSSPAGLTCASCAFDSSGCAATCDGALLEPGETCDGADLGSNDCTDIGYVNPDGALCEADCLSVFFGFCEPQCGNNVLEPDETCDGTQVFASCVDYGFSQPTPGEPSCSNGCGAVDPSGCLATCGDGNLEPGETCEDGNTISGDGCSAACQAEGTSCASPIPVSLGFGSLTRTGTTVGGGTTTNTSHALCPAGAAGPSRTLAVTVTNTGFLTAWLDRNGTSFNSVLYARTSCADDASTILCADSTSILSPTVAGGGEVVSFPVTAGDVIFLVIDSPALATQGQFSLTIDLSAGNTCGDPIPLPVWSGSPMTVLGFTNGQTQSGGGTCGGGGPGSGADDVVYRVERETNTITNMSFDLPSAQTDFDSILYARFDCGSNEITCNDSPSPTGGESIDLTFMTNDIRYVWIDGFNGDEGNYTMVVTPTP